MKRRFQGIYERRVFPWLNDKLAINQEVAAIRAEALSDARGRVVEVGFGTGLNLEHYPPGIECVVAIEPNSGMWERTRPRIRAVTFGVSLVGGEAERLPFRDGCFDTAVSVLTLCSVSDPARTIRELRRVLRNDGRLIVAEHGLSADPGVACWQHRLNRLQNAIACGCHLTRATTRIVEAGGFRFDRLRETYLAGAPRTHGWFTVGTAVKDATRAAGDTQPPP